MKTRLCRIGFTSALLIAALAGCAARPASIRTSGDPGTADLSNDAASGVRVLIAYHSRTGNTEKMAGGVAEGVGRVRNAIAVVKKVGDVTSPDSHARPVG